jgi:arylsulfatase A-like enzyme
MIRSTILSRLHLAVFSSGAALAGAALPAHAVAADAPRPNIVIITVDDQTYHFTSAFRKSRPDTTPKLRALAERGVRFTDGIVQAAQCKPSRNSMMTGRYPHQLGLYGNTDRFFIPKTVRGFPESLQRAGYYSAYFGKSHLIPDGTGIWASHGLERTRGMIRQFGFDLVSQSYGRRKSMVDARQLQQALATGAVWPYGNNIYLDHLFDRGLLATFVGDRGGITSLPADDYMDGFIARQVEDWLAGYNREQPFFLHVNFNAPHQPYDQPADFQDLYESRALPWLIDDPDMDDIPAVMKPDPSAATRRELRARRVDYAGMVTYLDGQVGRVLAALEARGVRENTLIVYHTDHGVMLGDHGLVQKATLYRQVLNANLVIDLPDALFPERTHVFRRPVELLDVVQTALHAAGVPPRERGRFEGESLLPALTDAVKGRYEREYAFAQIGGATAVVSRKWKYIEHETTPVLFDRLNDPRELVNVVADPANAGVVAAHRAALAELYERTGPPLSTCGEYPEPRDIVLADTRYLAPPRREDLSRRYASLSKYEDSCELLWARLRRSPETGGDAEDWCRRQGASLADETEVRRFVDHLNGHGKQAVLDRTGWPRDGRVSFIAKDDGSYRQLVRWNGEAYVMGSNAAASGYPLCVAR